MNCKVHTRNGITEIPLDLDLPSKELVLQICKKLSKDNFQQTSLVVLPRNPSFLPGVLLGPEDSLSSVPTFSTLVDTLDLYVKPVMVRVICDGSCKTTADAKQVLMDYSRPLVQFINILINAFCLNKDEFFFMAKTPSGDKWLNSHKTLEDYDFDIGTSYLVLQPRHWVIKRFTAEVMKGRTPDKSGFLLKQSNGKDKERSFGESVNFKDLSKKTRRWCVLKDNFLAYFKNQSDTVPAGIIAVDYHVMKLVEDKNTKQVSLTLERYVQGFGPKLASSFFIFYSEPDSSEIKKWFGAMQDQAYNTVNRVFGVPLEVLLARQARRNQSSVIPQILQKTVWYLDEHGLTSEGLFRVSGQAEEVSRYKELFDMGEDVDFSEVSSPHVVTGLLKLWLRELPEPLLLYRLYNEFIEQTSKHQTNPVEKVAAIFKVVEQLPEANIMILHFLCSFFHRVAKFEHLNKMGVSNLSLVIAPNLLRTKEELDPVATLKNASIVNDVVQILIQNEQALYDIVQRKLTASSKPSTQTFVPARPSNAGGRARGTAQLEVNKRSESQRVPTNNTEAQVAPTATNTNSATNTTNTTNTAAAALDSQNPLNILEEVIGPTQENSTTKQSRRARNGGMVLNSADVRAALGAEGERAIIEEFEKLKDRVQQLELQLLIETQARQELEARLAKLESKLDNNVQL